MILFFTNNTHTYYQLIFPNQKYIKKTPMFLSFLKSQNKSIILEDQRAKDYINRKK